MSSQCIHRDKSPRVRVTIYNETSLALRDVRIKFMNGERTAERIEPGGWGIAEMESGGDSGVFLSYRKSNGMVRTDEPIYQSLDDGGLDSGFTEVHVTVERTRLVKAIYKPFGLYIPVWTSHISPTGPITAK